MTDYSKINFSNIESSSQTQGVSGQFARKFINSKEIGVSLFKYDPHFKATRAHSHKVQEEVYVVVSGSGQILLDNEAVDLKLWDVIRVAPEVVRAFRAGKNGLDIIAIGGTKPVDGDGVPADAIWPNG